MDMGCLVIEGIGQLALCKYPVEKPLTPPGFSLFDPSDGHNVYPRADDHYTLILILSHYCLAEISGKIMTETCGRVNISITEVSVWVGQGAPGPDPDVYGHSYSTCLIYPAFSSNHFFIKVSSSVWSFFALLLIFL